MISIEKETQALKMFRKKKVVTVDQLAELLGAAIPTTRKRLKQWNTYTSYNMNGRFYTLPDIPVFNEYGIWEYRDIAFSKYGNLKETVIQLIIRSERGLMAREITDIVGTQYQSYLSHFRNSPSIQRKQINDIYVYFARDPHLFQVQIQRKEESLEQVPKQLPNDMDAILILVDWIKHPRSTIKSCAKRVRRKMPRVNVDLIRNLFDYHGIIKKN